MRYLIYMPPDIKDPRNKSSDGCLWKPAKRNRVRASKQLRFVVITETFNGNQTSAVRLCTYCNCRYPAPIQRPNQPSQPSNRPNRGNKSTAAASTKAPTAGPETKCK